MIEGKKTLLSDREESFQKDYTSDQHEWSQDTEPFWRTRRHFSNDEKHSTWPTWSSIYFIMLHLICVLLGTCLILRRVPDLALLDFDNRFSKWVPVLYELRREYALENPESEFTGLPNDENTRAWDELIQPTYFSASAADLQKTGESVNDSVLLLGGGYLAGLGVYHDIHCLRRLRLFLHGDYYYGELTEANMDYLREHLGHCIESLRRSVMCHADTNIFTFTWEGAEEVKPGILRPQPKSEQERKCVRWEALEEWLLPRNVPLDPWLLQPNGEEESVLMI